METIINTGERFMPNISSPRLAEEHIERYKFAQGCCIGKKVLDVACGDGYGSYELSQAARQVVGVDCSAEIINCAQRKYRSPNLDFIQSDCCSMQFQPEEFDVIVSFETIEHLNQAQRKDFLKLMNKYLKKEGLLILSTPNKRVTSPYTKRPLNKHHQIEFTKRSLAKEINQFFGIKNWLGQRFIFNLLLFKYIRKFIRLLEVVSRREFNIYSTLTKARVTKKNCNLLQPRIFVIKAQTKYV